MPAPISTPNTPISPNPPASMPPSSTFTFLPPLYPILQRLLVQQPNPSSPTSPQATTEATAPIEPKALPNLVSPIKTKIQDARAIVNGLPGVERSLEEQERVIRELEEEARRGEEVLRKLRGRARVIGEGELKRE